MSSVHACAMVKIFSGLWWSSCHPLSVFRGGVVSALPSLWSTETHSLRVSVETTYRVRRAVKRSRLNVYIAQRSGPTLRSILTRSALEPPQYPNQGNYIHGLPSRIGRYSRCTTKKCHLQT